MCEPWNIILECAQSLQLFEAIASGSLERTTRPVLPARAVDVIVDCCLVLCVGLSGYFTLNF